MKRRECFLFISLLSLYLIYIHDQSKKAGRKNIGRSAKIGIIVPKKGKLANWLKN